ncbi:SDR family NAD(P)-dependent oxidoreductase [Sinosporangium siamense]|uniref:Oxidoreductase n=1 Tax=Sinosporangium siamense TaxID=1367973 RepID=A0A919V5M7_9ACTN|nr:SDR family NAD(P)-dependent oxidoreductase [Sinosporangium siamense]GII90077.1 oxidoreductase [Sinosporangium siamense]
MIIVVAGAGGPAGQAAVEHFSKRGDTVIALDARPVPGGRVIDLLDEAAVRALAAEIQAEHGKVDGVFHVVGGWRGGKTFAETRLPDWSLLCDLLIHTLQNVTLAFEPLLRAADHGRFAIVSAKAAEAPTQGNAAYGAAKAASEAWTLAFADALKETNAAATILVVKALVHEAMRAEKPEAKFAGFTDVHRLAEAYASLFDRPAGEINGKRWDLTQ